MCSGSDKLWWHGQCRATCLKCQPCVEPEPEPEPHESNCDPTCTDIKSSQDCISADTTWKMCSSPNDWWHRQCKASCQKRDRDLPPCAQHHGHQGRSLASQSEEPSSHEVKVPVELLSSRAFFI
jgi:hypothetical protein